MQTYTGYQSVVDRVREGTRSKLRGLCLSWVITTASLFVLFNLMVGWDVANIFVAAIIATIAFVPLWGFYKIMRFTLGS